MNQPFRTVRLLASSAAFSLLAFGCVSPAQAQDTPPRVPRFSIDYMDRSVDPGVDFYKFADGNWVKHNPVPPDKARWGGFGELDQRIWFLLHGILEDAAAGKLRPSPAAQKVGDFYKSAMDTNRLEELAYTPLKADFERIEALSNITDFVRLVAEFQREGVSAVFSASVGPDAKDSSVYAFHIGQGGLGLPDRDYYLKPDFARIRDAYYTHMARMFTMIGDKPELAGGAARIVLDLETAIATISKPREDLRDPDANYHKVTTVSLPGTYPDLHLAAYLTAGGLDKMPDLIIGQPEFLAGLDKLVKDHELEEWKAYLRWHVLRNAAPYLNASAEQEAFVFNGGILSGQQEQEPRWQRVGRVVNATVGEALGQMFVEKYFPPAARDRMIELVGNLKAVFHDRLAKADWMTAGTRAKALVKFDRFTQKIGYPDKFRDYSRLEIRPDDYLGNFRRAAAFETDRQLARVGKPVDKTEWHMTPSTVNAYFNPSGNEIVFPAGILQPPFFDVEMDDAVNYGAIGVVIGHEITHGYDDEGRKFDADGNLKVWWTDDDSKAFEARAQKVIDQYNAYEPIPGMHVNGKLTLGENIADLGGTSIAYEALHRALAKHPAKVIDGFTPEQRFFISLSQIWRTNCREAELRRLLTVDSHSPGQYRAIGPHVNMQEFFDAFNIKPGAPMWRDPSLRAKIW